MWQSVKVKNVFNTLTLKQIFWKTKTFFKKLEYRFLAETTKIENISFPFKTALSVANVKTNRMATTKWTLLKEWSFAIWCTNYPNVHICTFRKRWSLILGCFFPVSILKKLLGLYFYLVQSFWKFRTYFLAWITKKSRSKTIQTFYSFYCMLTSPDTIYFMLSFVQVSAVKCLPLTRPNTPYHSFPIFSDTPN